MYSIVKGLLPDGVEIPSVTQEELQQKAVESYNNSIGHLNDIDGYNCTKCKNRGDFIYINTGGHMVSTPCKCKNIRRILKLAKNSGLGDILKDKTFKNFETYEDWQKDIKAKAESYCKDTTDKWFFIGGQVGAGKTHICIAISAYFIKKYQGVKYMLWSLEKQKLKSRVNESDYQDFLNPFIDADILYIDDFLKTKQGENPTNADINLAFDIINTRYNNNLKTIISSEKSLDELITNDEATMSRIKEKCGDDYVVNIERDQGRNYRLKTKK